MFGSLGISKAGFLIHSDSGAYDGDVKSGDVCQLHEQAMMATAKARGLREFVATRDMTRYARAETRAVDLGTGPGAMAERLREFLCEIGAVGRDARVGTNRLATQEFDRLTFAQRLGIASFDLVVASEVIEHLESPIRLLPTIAQLLAPGGVAIVTTPKVDSVPARLKFPVEGKIRMMDKVSDPEHLSPALADLLKRHFLPRSGLNLAEHFLFPPKGYRLTRPGQAWPLALVALVFRGDSLLGNNHISVFKVAAA